jgi:hypothetical protein
MEHTPQAGLVRNWMPSLGAAPLRRNFEEAVLDRILKYLNRRARRSNRSHFICFVLFLLAGRLCETA